MHFSSQLSFGERSHGRLDVSDDDDNEDVRWKGGARIIFPSWGPRKIEYFTNTKNRR